MKRPIALVFLAALFAVAPLSIGQAIAEEEPAPEVIWESEEKLDYPPWNGMAFESFLKVDEHIYTFRRSIHRTMILVTDEGVVVFDPLKPVTSERLYELIGKVTDKPVKYVFYTHNHWDHSRGAQVFKEAGATVVSHVNAKEWLQEHPHPEVVIPDMTWGEGEVFETADFTFGGIEMKTIFVGPSHGVGMTAFYFPQKELLHIVDIISPGRVPPGMMPDFSPRGEIAALNHLMTYDFQWVISAHEPPIVVDKKVVSDTARYYEIMAAGTNEAIEKVGDDGSPWDYMKVMQPPHAVDDKYKSWRMYDKWWKGNVVRVVIEKRLGL
jgi:glyoxylase-like metal-dependent hydrolase (beta-lactamase superfamily II)